MDFVFSFVNAANEVVMDNFLTRWQSVGLDNEDRTVLSAKPPTPAPDAHAVIPLPAAAWLLLVGIGGLGLISRRNAKAA